MSVVSRLLFWEGRVERAQRVVFEDTKLPQAPSSRIAFSVFGIPSSLITRFRL